ncbi:bacterial low temperature requirement A protein-domain-containing protein [Radiomyces spectabilis]|uniref:bacterial low temperature requirement A protein-domain-containing protein n=1 Tax=Radiomyces spectabilis TaxID=64574 RepID=UPI00221FC1CC|nr:bacterial low temperature requirement A protein-domain-containing protein [Radiomyces spectabilis]KAI8374764.1 bacterial low temperature requirement A protein-domain-containing protein [Radiomyces spectabilis]
MSANRKPTVGRSVRRGPTLRGGRFCPPALRKNDDDDTEEFLALNRSINFDMEEETIDDGKDVEMQNIDFHNEKTPKFPGQPSYHHGDETFGDVFTHPMEQLQAHRRRRQEYDEELNRWKGEQSIPNDAHGLLPSTSEAYMIVVHFRQLRGDQNFVLDHDTAEQFARKIHLTPQERIQFNGIHDTDKLTAFLYKTKREFSIKIHHKAEIARHAGNSNEHLEHNPNNHIIEFNSNVYVEFKPMQYHHHAAASTSHTTRRPFFRHPEPDLSADIGEEKAPSWLELFYDLFFVATLTEFTHSVAIKDWASLGLYAQWFVITWWAWASSSLYTARFDTDDVVHHIYKIIEMCAVIGMAGPADYFLTSRGYAYGYIALKGVLVIEYSVVLTVALISRSKSWVPLASYVAANIVSIILWGASLTIIEENYHRALWYAGLVVEVVVIMLVERDKSLSWAASHLAERLGLLTLIVLGENLMGLIGLAATSGTDILIVLPNFMAVVVIFGFFFMYFEDFNKEVFLHSDYHQIWVYLHFPLHLCQVAFGIALIDTLRVYRQQMKEDGKITESEHTSTTTEHGATSSEPSETSSAHETGPSAPAHKLAKKAVDEVYAETWTPMADNALVSRSVKGINDSITNRAEGLSAYSDMAKPVGYLSLCKYYLGAAAITGLQAASVESSSHLRWVKRAGAEEHMPMSDDEKVFIYKTFLICGGLILVINSLIKLLNTKISDIYGKIIIGSRVLNAVVLWSMCALPFAKLDAIVLLSVITGSLIFQAMVDLLD